jgi:hypothetical protein
LHVVFACCACALSRGRDWLPTTRSNSLVLQPTPICHRATNSAAPSAHPTHQPTSIPLHNACRAERARADIRAARHRMPDIRQEPASSAAQLRHRDQDPERRLSRRQDLVWAQEMGETEGLQVGERNDAVAGRQLFLSSAHRHYAQSLGKIPSV